MPFLPEDPPAIIRPAQAPQAKVRKDTHNLKKIRSSSEDIQSIPADPPDLWRRIGAVD